MRTLVTEEAQQVKRIWRTFVRRDKVTEKLHLIVLIVMLLLALWAIPAQAQESVDTPAATEGADAVETIAGGWFRTTIDGSSAETGRGQNSIAVRADGKTFVSYYNATKKSLDVAMQVLPLQGNCGTDQAWVCMTVDDSDTLEMGMANAIALYPTTNLPAVAYIVGDPSNPVNFALKFALATGCTTTCSWNISTIQAFSLNFRANQVDLVFSTNDNKPHVAYTVINTQAPSGVNHTPLYYATIAGNGACSGGASGWQCAVIDNGGRGVTDVAIGLNANQRPRIVYSRYDMTGENFTNSWLMLAAYSVNSGNCGPQVNGSSTWTCTQLRQFADYAPSAVDVAMNGSDTHIAYVNQIQSRLHYMALDFGDLNGNCGPNTQWHCAEIEATGYFAKPSIVLRQGTPFIAYTDKNDTNPAREILKLATPQAIGNCGPEDGLFFSWQCTTLDNGVTIGPADKVGFAPTIGFDAQRSALEIAYGVDASKNLVIVENHRPAPVLTSLGQNSTPAGSASVQVLITGKNFANDAWVVKDGVYVPTERLSSTQVRATLDAAGLQQVATVNLRVCNPPFPLTDCSNSAPFQITDPVAGPQVFLPLVTK